MGKTPNRNASVEDGINGSEHLALSMKESNHLRDAVQNMHGGTATLAQSVPVREIFQGQTVWEGVVHVFDLAGHPTATRAYSWHFPAEGSDKPRYVAVLHTDRINSPLQAVRAAIVAEQKAKRQ